MAAKCLYQMYDVTAQQCAGPVIPEVRDASAIRAFNEVLADAKTLPGQFPADFQLLCVGEQDDSTAVIVAYLEPRVVTSGVEFLAAREAGNASDK